REGALALHLALGAVGADHRDAPGAPGAAAGEPEGRGLGPLQTDTGLGGAVQDPPHALDAAAAAVAAGAPAVGHDLVALDPHGEAHLEDLDRRVHRVRDAGRHPVDPVLGRPRAEATLDGLVAHVAVARAWVDPAQGEDRGGPLGARHH